MLKRPHASKWVPMHLKCVPMHPSGSDASQMRPGALQAFCIYQARAERHHQTRQTLSRIVPGQLAFSTTTSPIRIPRLTRSCFTTVAQQVYIYTLATLSMARLLHNLDGTNLSVIVTTADTLRRACSCRACRDDLLRLPGRSRPWNVLTSSSSWTESGTRWCALNVSHLLVF